MYTVFPINLIPFTEPASVVISICLVVISICLVARLMFRSLWVQLLAARFIVDSFSKEVKISNKRVGSKL